MAPALLLLNAIITTKALASVTSLIMADVTETRTISRVAMSAKVVVLQPVQFVYHHMARAHVRGFNCALGGIIIRLLALVRRASARPRVGTRLQLRASA